jgi:Na+-driven multidrug efflux pump
MAAHARANSILSLYNTTAGALTALTSTVCGQCYGARRYDLTRAYGKNLIKVGRFLMLATSLILYPLTPLLMLLYNVPAESMRMIYISLAIAAVGMPLFSCDSNITAMVLRVAGVIALALGRCVLGYVLTITLGLGVPGIWIALVFEWVLRAVVQHVRLRGEAWLHQT